MREEEIIERIKELCRIRSWTYYRLAKESGITYSTLCTLLNKSGLPSIPTLIKICDAFGITLSEFFDDGTAGDAPTRDEWALLLKLRSLNKSDRKSVETFINFLIFEKN